MNPINLAVLTLSLATIIFVMLASKNIMSHVDALMIAWIVSVSVILILLMMWYVIKNTFKKR